jgi:hypothetical protein
MVKYLSREHEGKLYEEASPYRVALWVYAYLS